MLESKGYGARTASTPLELIHFQRREVGEKDVLIQIDYCGVCHSDIHSVRNEWGGAQYPLIPGHEIVGRVSGVGKSVTQFKVGDLAGVGCLVDSCRVCPQCQHSLEQYCDQGPIFTYNSPERNSPRMTYGGYSNQIVVDESFVLKISPKLELSKVAPLLCAGITTYSPLRHWKVKKGDKVGIVGLGGLGHMAVKLAAAMGAEVTLFSTSKQKEKDAKALGAHHFGCTKDLSTFSQWAHSLDLIINTISAPHDYNAYLNLLRLDGTMVLLGAPPQGLEVAAFSLIGRRRNLAGSLIGGLKETQEMLDFCVTHQITADVEVISMREINQAYERMLKGDVKYRFVIDLKTLEV